MDVAVHLTLSVAFGAFVTAHVALVIALATRRPRWHALAALAFAPLAPYLGFRERRRAWSALWLVALAGYGVTLLFALTRVR